MYDAYLAPFKHRHQYWFGISLILRGVLQLLFTSVFAIPQNINLLVLLALCVLLISYIAILQPYKLISVMVLDISFLMNLILLSGLTIYGAEKKNALFHTAVVGTSIGLAFLQFCGIVIYALITSVNQCCPRICNECSICKKNESDDEQMDELSDRYFSRQPYQMFNNALQVQPPIGRRREDPTY